MTAYGAVTSLKNTIQDILLSSRLSILGPSVTFLGLAYNELQPLLNILERLDSTSKSRSRKKVNALDAQIKEAAWQFEDSLETLLSHQITSQFENPPDQRNLREKIQRRRSEALGKDKAEASAAASQSQDLLLFSIDLQRLRDNLDPFIQTLKGLEEEYIHELENMPEDEYDDDGEESVSSSKMIGLSDQLEETKYHIMHVHGSRRSVTAVVGTAGIGKTTLAKEIFRDPEISSHFERRAWVKVGRIPQLDRVSRDIRAQLCGIDEEISMEGKKCLVVVDDVWESMVLNSLMSSLPENKDGTILVLVTTRDLLSASDIDNISKTTRKAVRFLNQEESKQLLCEKVFGGKIFPPQLDKAATKIAKNCEGLPLMIVTVAGHLARSQNTDLKYWEDVAEKRNSVFKDSFIEISKVLFPSYNYLSQQLKMIFLYLGVLPLDYEAPPNKLINMVDAEGWLRNTDKHESLEHSFWLYLIYLCEFHYLVLFKKKSLLWYGGTVGVSYKSCRLHSSWWHLCVAEARKNKFFQVLNRLVDAEEEEGIEGQRCLSLHNNILFGIKEFRDSVKCYCASSARSLLFFGPYHQFPTPIDVGFKLLRELDALNLRFYTFPTEILMLVQLKYLALTCNGELPTTISKLFNLKILIIHPHINIHICGAPSYIPMQIWDMQELNYIEILGRSLVAPNHVASLKKLYTLLGVNASICTILDFLKKLPRIRTLGVQIELTPYEDRNDLLNCFDCISKLESLEILKCSIINPVVKYDNIVVPSTPSSLMFPQELTKLHLSGIGFPWEYMDVIGSLPHLKVLKLRCYAFRGPTWEPQGESFLQLEFLLIEDTDLVQWKPGFGSFPKLSYLSMKHCYKLEELHWPSLRVEGKIELVDCNPLASTYDMHFGRREFDRLVHTASFEQKSMPIELKSEKQLIFDKLNKLKSTINSIKNQGKTGDANKAKTMKNKSKQ